MAKILLEDFKQIYAMKPRKCVEKILKQTGNMLITVLTTIFVFCTPRFTLHSLRSL